MVKKELTSDLNRLVNASFLVFISIILAKLFSYLYKVIIARYLGGEQYGLFSISLIIVSLVSTISIFGFNDSLITYIPKYLGLKKLSKAREVFNFSLKIAIPLSIFFMILIILLADTISNQIYQNSNLSIYLKIMAISIPFAVFSGIYLALIRSFEEIKIYTFLVNAFQGIAKLVFLIILIFIGIHFSLPLSYTLSVFFLGVLSFIFSKKNISYLNSRSKNKSKLDAVTKKEFVKYSWPFILIGILYTLFYSTDSLLLGYFTNATDVGIYNIAITIITLFFIFPELFMQLFIPLISKKISQNKNNLTRDLTKQISKWIFLFNLPLFIAIVIYPGVIINLLFGPNFLSAITPLKILAIGGILSSYMSMLGGLVSLKGKSKTVLMSFTLTAILNIILDLILIPNYGMNGAAIATTISWATLILILSLKVKEGYGFYPIKPILIRIFFISLVPLLINFIAEIYLNISVISVLVMAIISGVVYFALLWYFSCIDENDFQLIRPMFNRIKNLRN